MGIMESLLATHSSLMLPFFAIVIALSFDKSIVSDQKICMDIK